MKSYIILIFLFACVGLTHGSSPTDFLTRYDNISVITYNEGNGEEYQKAYIIGQLANILAKELKYTGSIYLESHVLALTAKKKATKYQLSIRNHIHNENEEDRSEKLIIRQDVQQYDITDNLRLIEYAIENKSKIKKQQRLQKGNLFYDREKDMLFVDESMIEDILKRPTSQKIANVLKTRIARPFWGKIKPDITYYWQDGLYYIGLDTTMSRNTDRLNFNKIELKVLLTLSDIYQLDLFQSRGVIFDSDSSFYYINTYPYQSQSDMKVVSSRQIIEDIGERDTGKKVNLISDNDISIYFLREGKKQSQRLLFFFHESQTLIQDAYKMLAIPPTKFIRTKV